MFWAWPLEERSLHLPWIQEVDAIVETARASHDIATAYRGWKALPQTAAGFGPFERREFLMTHTIASARIADLYATSSDVASLPSETQAALLDRVRELSREQPPVLHLPGRSVVDLCRRVESPHWKT